MCKLFGISGDLTVARGMLLDGPTSLCALAVANRDGAGVGRTSVDAPSVIVKTADYERTAETLETVRHAQAPEAVVAHVRAATVGGVAEHNAHPFELVSPVSGTRRVFAHNGTIMESQRILDELRPEYLDLIQGSTDSERFFAFVTQLADDHGGSLGAGLAEAVLWVAAHLPITSVNTLVADGHDLWALRYPTERPLHIAQGQVDGQPYTVVATEPADELHDWVALEPGELVRLRDGEVVDRRVAISSAPARPLHWVAETGEFFDARTGDEFLPTAR